MTKSLKLTVSAVLMPAILCGCSKPQTHDESHIGYVEAKWVYISAPEPGWITSRPVYKGDRLNIGDVVFELDKDQQTAAIAEASGRVDQAAAQAKDLTVGARPAEIRALEANLSEAEAQMAQARAERDRTLPLVAKGVEPRNRGDVVTANYNMARARVDAAKEAIDVAKLSGRDAAKEAALAAQKTAQAAKNAAQINLGRRTIISQTSGRIEDVFHYQGEYVTMGAPVLAVLPDDGLKVKFFASQSELPSLAVGDIVHVKADGNTSPVEAVISYISDQTEFTPPVIYSVESREKLVFMIEADLPKGTNLHAGLPVDVDF